ncbi:MAG: hypothetical protein AB9846_05960 [Tenuifilaceae bacterium]
MRRDFTISEYTNLLNSLLKKGYQFQTFSDFLIAPLERTIILRHDVDRKPENSLQTAKIENELGIKGSYYFRIVQQSFNSNIIKEIISLGHEIGYHYEDVDIVSRKGNSEARRQKTEDRSQTSDARHQMLDIRQQTLEDTRKGEDQKIDSLIDRSFIHFKEKFEFFKQFYPVRTICMHGSPLSKYDNRLIWTKYNYKELGIIGEPYFDVDFSKVFYLTDTGRRWDGEKVSIRDKVQLTVDSKQRTENGNEHQKTRNLSFKHTTDILKVVEEGNFPDQVMITVHPQRWSNSYIPWFLELIGQNFKNLIKRYIVEKRKQSRTSMN